MDDNDDNDGNSVGGGIAPVEHVLVQTGAAVKKARRKSLVAHVGVGPKDSSLFILNEKGDRLKVLDGTLKVNLARYTLRQATKEEVAAKNIMVGRKGNEKLSLEYWKCLLPFGGGGQHTE
jgi:hypothetical protein